MGWREVRRDKRGNIWDFAESRGEGECLLYIVLDYS